jgi:hypothetical protein
MSKKLLFENLKQFDLNRLRRAEKRRRNKKSKSYFFHESNGNEEVEEEEEEEEEVEIEVPVKSKRRRSSRGSSIHASSSSPITSTKAHKKPRTSRKSKCDDDMDPIMRTPLGKNVFTFVRPNGSFTRFNVETLVDYMLETGDFTDPASRLSFSDEDLKMIDDLVCLPAILLC